MLDSRLIATALLAAVQHWIGTRLPSGPEEPDLRDRGAVSLEQALWYAAAAVAVAVVAGIIWASVRSTASTPVNVPAAP